MLKKAFLCGPGCKTHDDASTSTIVIKLEEDIDARHQKEEKDMMDKIQELKDADKNVARHKWEKREVTCAQMLQGLKVRHAKEKAEFNRAKKLQDLKARHAREREELENRHKAELAEAENEANTIDEQPGIELKSLSAALPAKSGDEGTSGAVVGKSDAEASAPGLHKEKKIGNKADSKRKHAVKENKVGALIPSDKEVEMDTINAMLAERNLVMADVPPDGDCMYQSISHQLRYFGIGGVDVRLACANYLKQHREDFEPFIDGDADDPEKNWETYIKGVEKSAMQGGVWGGELELSALSKALQRVIEVFKNDGLRRFGEEFASPNKQRIRIVYLRHQYSFGEHYNSTIRLH